MGFWRSVFSDGGTGSFSRVISAIITINVLILIDFVTWKTRAIPSTDTIALLPLVLAFYGTNVLGNVATRAVLKPPKPEQTIVADHAEVTQENK